MSFEEEDSEQTLFVCKECFVYKLPPRSSAAGYKAADWDITNFIWSGKLTVRSIREQCIILLEDPNTGELFATCPVTPGAVEPVSDSSRYFVIKIDDGKGHHAFVGMGFTERSESFDFNAALQDHSKYLKQKKEAVVAQQQLASMPHKDYSLPEGAKIHVNIKSTKPTPTTKPALSSQQGMGMVLLPPPGSKKTPTIQPVQQPQQRPINDIWSDFTGSATTSNSNQNSGWSAFN